MSKTHTPKIDKGCTPVRWTMTGRGKARTFYVVTADDAAEGDRVAAVSGRGKVTYGTLAEYNGPTDDGRHRWTLEHDTARNADVDLILANKRAEEPESTYWTTDAGRETASKIAARMMRAASKRAAAETVESKPEPEPVEEPASPSESEPVAAARAALVAETVAALVKSGASADVIAATVAALESPTVESKPEPKSPSKPARASKPRKSPSKSPSETVDTCDACNLPRKGCKPHAGSPHLVTCPRCSTLDADTAERRAARHT